MAKRKSKMTELLERHNAEVEAKTQAIATVRARVRARLRANADLSDFAAATVNSVLALELMEAAHELLVHGGGHLGEDYSARRALCAQVQLHRVLKALGFSVPLPKIDIDQDLYDLSKLPLTDDELYK